MRTVLYQVGCCVPAIALVGPMGAGKTTLGCIVSRALRVQCTDTDLALEVCLGVRIWQVFANLGELQFRKWEFQVAACSFAPVNSYGGGIVSLSQCRYRLNYTLGVHVDGNPGDITHNVGASCRERPLYRAFDRHLRALRDPMYRSSATASLPLGGLTAPQVACNLLLSVQP
ncbi:shikimate kinase [Candidatus Tremblaya princeps]|uniref:Shikimate kinase n=1 Tax=Tremblaya princeps TaxID=189385 RepID=A0A1C3K990_TREPR|nr:Shikimate kinase [Candidatus Tremblaya princeps]